MSEPFDPYRDWLGIDVGGSAVDHYRILGLPRFEGDPRKILAAVNAAVARLEKIDPASYPLERLRLMDELQAAKRCLLNPAARSQYDAALAGAAGRSQARPAAGPSAPPTSVDQPSTPRPGAPQQTLPLATPLPVVMPVAPPVVVVQAPQIDVPVAQAASPAPLSASLWEDIGSSPVSSTAPERELPVQAPGRTALAILLGFLLASAILGLGGLIFWIVRGGRENAQADAPGAAAVSAEAVSIEPRPSPDRGSAGAPMPAAAQSGAETESSRITPVADLSAAAASTKAAPAKPSTPAAKPAAAAEAAGDFSRAAGQVRADLAARNVQAARDHLAETMLLAGSPAEHDQIRRLSVLADQQERFLAAMRAGLRKFTATDVLELGDEVVAVIETGPESMAVRSEGSRHDYTLATMPAPLALVVARAGADENAAPVKVFFGAFHALDPQGDRETARRLWREAGAAGQPVADLLPLLNAAAGEVERQAVPDEAARKAAEARVVREFDVTIKGAKSAEQRSFLVDHLLAAAAEADESADQYALLTEACARAATAGDTRRAFQAVDELDRRFRIDALAAKSETLAKALTATRDPAASAPIAQAALTLLDEVQKQKRDELARSLALTAVTAARRSRDAKLLEQATSRRREVERAAGAK